MALRVVFAGTPEAAVPALRACHTSPHTVAQVWTQPPRPRGRRGTPQPSPVHAAADALGLAVRAPADLRDPAELDALRACGADVGVVVAYGHILRDDWLAALPLGWINLHFSLLPRWRGATPVAAAIRAGDPETGVSVIQIVRALDAGPVWCQRSTPFDADETRGVLEARLAELGAPLLVETLDALEAGTAAPEPQEESQASYAPQLTKDDGHIDWTRDAVEIQRHIMAVQPWPGAWTTLHCASRAEPLRLQILAASAADEPPGDPAPGVVTAAQLGGVATGRGSLSIQRVQPQGKQPMGWDAFLNGYRVAVGDRFA